MQMTVWESRARMGRKRVFCSNQNDPLRKRRNPAIWRAFILHSYPDWQVFVGTILYADN